MRQKDFIVGLAMLATGIVYFIMSRGVPNRDGVDAATVPTMLAVMMIGLGAAELFTVWRRGPAPAMPEGTAETGVEAPDEAVLAADASVERRAFEAAQAEEESHHARDNIGLVTVGITLALIAVYVAMLSRLGFPIATTIYLFVQFIVLTPSSVRRPYALYAVIALIASAVIFATFRYGFGLLLPAGPLTTLLP
ncbi:MAG: tripartite tricarboxylate transporter TctB family protein [Paracoccus sp. (in: a-proteobacteria)]|uniref:tripartite tricarboxylate transporter TctB family protein n=1 Tax=Paracoccus sp. TaxID=267 RepID=UPI0026DFDC2E|nr:tripartite tricarboxylate transporter TctB family protein [Paracoccus sp. (in: a-proteobacteria)]MDO5623018.1 tripartite tricarboxylate transporter TctB family protein [Paracoccus sp. (in: a-proteobacteria)]MDO5659071.1 tripartite tricarboxylate transporter TctB family protein [Paracoccus sp. (in: a-proteobacteria)]